MSGTMFRRAMLAGGAAAAARPLSARARSGGQPSGPGEAREAAGWPAQPIRLAVQSGRAIGARVNRAVRAALADPAPRARFAAPAGTVADLSPKAFTAFICAEVARWAPVVQASGARVD